MTGLEIGEIDGDGIRIGRSVEREGERQCSNSSSHRRGRPDPPARALLVGSVHVQERGRIDTGKCTDRGSRAVELREFGATLVTRPEVPDDVGDLSGNELTIEIRRQLLTEVPTRDEVTGRVEDGKGTNGSSIGLQAPELGDRVKIGLERDDHLREFLLCELTIEVARQQHEGPIRLWCHTGHVSIPLSIDRPRWIRDRTVPTGTSVASAISSYVRPTTSHRTTASRKS